MILTKDNPKIFYYMLIAYTFFAFLSTLSSMFFVMLIALMLLSLFVLNDSDKLCFWAYASCYMACFNIESMFLKIVDLMMAILLIKQLILAIKNKNKKNICFVSLVLALCLIAFVYGLCISKFKVYKYWQGFGIILSIATIYFVGNVNVKKLTLILSLGLITSSMLSIISYNCGILPVAPYMETTSYVRFGGYFNYVNALALYCSLCQTCLLTLFLINKLDIKKWFWLVLVITFIGFCTFSKSFLLITIITYVLATILGFVKSNNKKRFVLFLVAGLAIVALLAIIFNNYLDLIIGRFYGGKQTADINTATTGRFGIWKTYFKYWSSSPLYVLFGCGITADSVGKYTPHNFFITLLYRFGIVGVIMLIAMLVFIFKQLKLNKNIYCYLPVGIVLLNAFFEDISSSLFTCLPLLIAIFFILKDKTIAEQK